MEPVRFLRSFLTLAVLLVISVSVALPLANVPASTASAFELSDSASGFLDWSGVEEDGFVYRVEGDSAVCWPATLEEARAMAVRDPDAELRAISSGQVTTYAAGDINIVLRGTAQLDSFPQAREAFLRAADQWKTQIRAPITIIIDVDFGPTRFGTPYAPGVLGSTGTQTLGNSSGYTDVRAGLIAMANSAAEASLDNSLPTGTVPTDLGAVTGFSAPSAELRALAIINPVADPAGEQSQFGSPPSIGFNSNFAFDFDPTNGIDADKFDFDAVAVHEVGHALGFSSRVGARELNPSAPLTLSVLDLFRFRPGVTTGTFSTAQRILSSGGNHIFFDGGSDLPLSTGRSDGTGGDGNQASHWKDNTFVGSVVGIMDPTIARGERDVINASDLRAFDILGYQLAASAGDPGGPELRSANYNDDGGVMIVKGGGFTGQLQIEVNGLIVAPPARIKVKGGGAKLKIPGSRAELNLRAGVNTVRVINNGLRSAVVILSL